MKLLLAAPAGFGRQHVAPLVGEIVAALRREDPRWADRYASLAVRDGVTGKAIG